MGYIVTILGCEVASTKVLRTKSDFLIVLSVLFQLGTLEKEPHIGTAFLGVFVSMSLGNFLNCELIWEGLHYFGWCHSCAGCFRCFSVNLEEQANKQHSSMFSVSVLRPSFYLGFPLRLFSAS